MYGWPTIIAISYSVPMFNIGNAICAPETFSQTKKLRAVKYFSSKYVLSYQICGDPIIYVETSIHFCGDTSRKSGDKVPLNGILILKEWGQVEMSKVPTLR